MSFRDSVCGLSLDSWESRTREADFSGKESHVFSTKLPGRNRRIRYQLDGSPLERTAELLCRKSFNILELLDSHLLRDYVHHYVPALQNS